MMLKDPRVIRKEIELGNTANLKVNFVSVGGTDEYEAQFIHKVSGECVQSGRGNTLEKAFIHAYKDFDTTGYKKSPRELAEENARLRKELSSVEPAVEDNDTSAGAKDKAPDSKSDLGGDVTPVKKVRRKRTTKQD